MAEENGMEILYIRTEYTNPLMQLLAGGMFKPGTDGFELDNKLNLVNDNVFSKSIADSFSNAAFENYLISKEVSSLYIVGADAAGCVLRTAQGAKNRNYSVTIIRDAVISAASDSKMKQVEEQRAKSGINAAFLNDVIPLHS
jgi:nicotinamidase-related amidase